MTILYKTISAAETVNLGKKIGKCLKPGAIVALSGDLGAGKTYLTKGIVLGLGLKAAVRSPTFVLLNIYEGGTISVYHFDCYRLKGAQDMEKLGYEEYFYGEGVSVIEWADKIPELIPKEAVKVVFKILAENRRQISVRGLAMGEGRGRKSEDSKNRKK